MTDATHAMLSGFLSMGLPVLWGLWELWKLRRAGAGDARRRVEAPDPAPRPLPDCLVPRPSPFLPAPAPRGRVPEDA